MNLNKKLITGIIAAILIFLVVNLVYFSPAIGGDNVLYQTDIRMFKGSAKEIQEFREQTGGEEALWTNSMFGGMPAYQISTYFANKSLSVLNGAMQLWLWQPMGMVFLYFIGFFILMMCLGVDKWVSVIGSIAFGMSSYLFTIIEAGHNTQAVAIGYAPALIGGVILLFRKKWLLGFVVTALFMGLELYANHPQITYYTFLVIALYLIGEFIGFLKEKDLKNYFKALVFMIAAIGVGFLPNISSLWTTAEYGKYTTRGPSELTLQADGTKNTDSKALKFDYATDYSYGVDESFTLLIPDFKGSQEQIGNKPETMEDVNPDLAEDVAQQSFYFAETTPVYVGCLIVLLTVIGMIVIKNRIKWPLLIAAIIALMLSWGKHFEPLSRFFFDHFPYYNKFRAVSMLMTMVELILPIIAALAIDQIIKDQGKNLKEKMYGKYTKLQMGVLAGVGSIVLFLLINLVSPSAFNSFSSKEEMEMVEMQVENAKGQIANELQKRNPGITEQQLASAVEQQASAYGDRIRKTIKETEKPRMEYVKSSVWRTLLFILLGGGLLMAFVFNKLSKTVLLAGMGLLVVIDLWMINWRSFNKENFVPKEQEQEFEFYESDKYIINDKNAINFRVFNTGANPFNNGSFSYYHKSIGGYHGAKLKKYQELIEFHLRREQGYAAQIADMAAPDSIKEFYMNRSCAVLNMLNTRYIITRNNMGGVPFLNKAANGNAWFVSQVRWAPNADSEIVWLEGTNTKTTAVIQEKFKEQLQGWDKIAGSWANIKLENYKPNHLTYSFDSKSKQLIVFSEIYYPAGWNAYIDGKLTPHVAANYVLRAMMVPEGKHTIEFKFEPKSYYTGEKISTAGVIVYYLVIIGGFGFLGYRRFKKKDEKTTA